MQRCNACGGWQWGPEYICHRCHSFDLGFEQVTVQKRKPIVLPDDILSNYMDAQQIASYKASGTGIFSITVAAGKPSTGGATDNAKATCCAPNAEGTAKVKVATGEECGCGIDSTCC